MISPAAYFDALSLGRRMTELVDGFTRPELHLFAYAACLLSVYDGCPVADWGYEFVSADNGLPFSQEIDEAIEVGVSLDLFHSHGTLLVLTDLGRHELEGLLVLQSSNMRERFVAGAADALLVYNPGNIREAFNYDPAISYLRSSGRVDWVLSSAVVARLYENFRQLQMALDFNTRDLSIPFVSWLQYLIQTGRAKNS